VQLSYTSTEIISFTQYSDLFPKDVNEAKVLLRKLQKQWHPDHCNDSKAKDVFIKIMELYELGPANIKYSGPTYTRGDGVECTFKSVASCQLSFATVYYTDKNAVLIQFNDDSKFLIDHFKENVQFIQSNIPSDKKDKYQHTVPRIYPIKDDDKLIIQMPDADYVPLLFVQKYIAKTKDYRLAFWIISRAFDISMVFNAYGNKVANGYIIPLCFINMKKHTMLDLSCYLLAAKDKLHALDDSQISFYSPVSLMNKVPDHASDVALIKAFGLRLIGDSTGTGLALTENPPDAMLKFLCSISPDNKLGQYKRWQSEISKQSFGQIKFHDLVIPFNQLLNQYKGA